MGVEYRILDVNPSSSSCSPVDFTLFHASFLSPLLQFRASSSTILRYLSYLAPCYITWLFLKISIITLKEREEIESGREGLLK